jgi:hypothetical protein
MADEQSLLGDVVDECKQEHSALIIQLGALDTKAQGAIATAGIFVAAILAFINGIAGESTGDRVFLTIAALLLAACILSALRVLFVRRVGTQPSGKDFLELVKDLVRNGPPKPSDLRTLAHDHIRMWTESVTVVRKVVDTKALYLRLAHCLLASAIVLGVIDALTRIWTSS